MKGKKKLTDTQLAFHVRFLMIRRYKAPLRIRPLLLSPESEVLESSSQKPQASLTRTACASALTRIEGVDFLAYGEGLDQTQRSELLPELVFACIWLTGCCF